ncbi:MAG TPA: ABC transporter [Clostridiales bacterium UBA8960]|jgi:cell division transport system ATP-binding protein|nr:ABC transporter [Clostridiales bacterium UBA8960]
MIKAENCSLQYKDGTLALKPFHLNIGHGETLFVMGPSGSGKTSLLKLILGIEMPSQGTFEVLGQPIKPGHEASIRLLRTKIGPIFQEFRLLEGRSVLENVILGLRFLDYSSGEMKTLANEYLERVGLGHKIHHTVDRLSWGECQRVAIARAVVRKPKLIVADEPTGNLDKSNAINVLKLLASFNDGETSVIITTHATHLVEHVSATSRLHMKNGEFEIERCLNHG